MATVFHASLGLCVIKSGVKSVAIEPQSLQVSLVAPSTSMKVLSHSSSPIQEKVFDKSGVKSAMKKMKNDGRESEERKTTGRESPDAKATNSAVTEPDFNAAYLKNPSPAYPPSAKKSGIQGKVLLLVGVSAEGYAKSVKVHESSGYSILDNAAKSAVSAWKFVPATQGGNPVEANVIVPIEFKLNLS